MPLANIENFNRFQGSLEKKRSDKRRLAYPFYAKRHISSIQTRPASANNSAHESPLSSRRHNPHTF